MQIAEPLEHLQRVHGDERLGQLAKLAQDVRERTVLDKLHDDVQHVTRVEALSILDNVRVLEQLEQVDLTLEQLQLVLAHAPQRHLLDRHRAARLEVERLVHHAARTAADLVSHGVPRADDTALALLLASCGRHVEGLHSHRRDRRAQLWRNRVFL